MGSARMGKDPFGPRVRERFPVLVPQGVSAELVAQRWSLSRTRLDEYARSHARADATRVDGGFKDEIVPVQGDGSSVVADDETIRAGTIVQRLGELAPAFGSTRWSRASPTSNGR